MTKKKVDETKKEDGKEQVSDAKVEETKAETTSELKENDFVYVDITGRIKKTNKAFLTTIKEIAEKEDLYDEKEQLLYEPHLVIVGDNLTIQGFTISGVSKQLIGMKLGEVKAITVPPKDAFGERSNSKIKDYTMKKIKAVEKNPRPGKRITIDNKTGLIIRVDTRGRVKVDFNHPLAGLDVVYEITIKEILTDEKQKLNALIKSKIPLKDMSQIIVERVDNSLNLTIPGEIAFSLARYLPVAKITLTMDIQKYFPAIETINFIEKYGKNLFGQALTSVKPEAHDHTEEPSKEENHNHK